MSSCLRNIRAKNYSNLLILFKVTIENVRDVFGTQCIIQTPYDSRIQGHPSDPPLSFSRGANSLPCHSRLLSRILETISFLNPVWGSEQLCKLRRSQGLA